MTTRSIGKDTTAKFIGDEMQAIELRVGIGILLPEAADYLGPWKRVQPVTNVCLDHSLLSTIIARKKQLLPVQINTRERERVTMTERMVVEFERIVMLWRQMEILPGYRTDDHPRPGIVEIERILVKEPSPIQKLLSARSSFMRKRSWSLESIDNLPSSSIIFQVV